ncbi:MAG: hypothetical protein Q9207_008025 [Kuettlingeria erythrocarpa]
MSMQGDPPAGGDRNHAPMLRAVLGSELAVASIVIALRFFTRLKLTRSPGMDDWIMLATFISAVIGTSMDLAGMEYGIGRHIYYLDHDDGVLATKLDWLCQAFVITALTIGKISVAFLILRISITKWHAYFLHTINVLLLLINIPLIVWTYAQCQPPSLLWDPSLAGACEDPRKQGSFALFQGFFKAFGAVTDLIYALFPILIIWPLQMPRKRKYQLAGIMCLGTFSAVAGAVKTYYLHQLRARADFTYDATDLMIWYTTEMYVIIIAGSLPTLRPLFQATIATYHSHKQRSSKGYLTHEEERHSNSHALHSYPKKNTNNGCTPRSLDRRDNGGGRSSDQDVLAKDVEGITKTVDFTVATETQTGKQQWDRWEDEEFGARRMREDERV